MTSHTIFPFPGSDNARLSEVGGKGLSLLKGSSDHLPVPPGFILSVSFFAPWWQELKKSTAWHNFTHPDKYTLEQSCTALKKHALKLVLTQEQENALSRALNNFPTDTFFAVRSSSPEEDLEGASFAGGYETILGVNQTSIRNAIKKAFASCLDYRVTVYKRENGFDIFDPKIAVIIQEQIASEVAGVGFSLNPVTNNFDEAVINANFGLGETVVQGIATPDMFTVNKRTLHIDHQLGAKETSMWLQPNGGTEKKKDRRSDEYTLTDEQIRELTGLIKKVETLYQKPMDIEWAYAKNKLYLLQARPITAYIPLSHDTLTLPGERKRLYFDVTTTAQGIDQPISVMGVSSFRRLVKIVGGILFGRDITKNINTSIACVASNGRLYANGSVLLRLFGEKRIVQTLPIIDPIAAKALATLDVGAYMATANRVVLLPRGVFLRLPHILLLLLRAERNAEKVHQEVQQELIKFERYTVDLAAKDLPLTQLWDTLLRRMFHQVFLRTVVLTFAARKKLSDMKKMAGESLAKEADRFELALPHNVTAEMGLRLSDVASFLPESINAATLQKRLISGDLPPEFVSSWQAFLEKYGMRGPSEIDMAAPRYREHPEFLLDLMVTMRHAPSEENTQNKFAQHAKLRQEVYETIYTHLLSENPKTASKFASLYNFFVTFGGYRETHKYYLVFVVDLLRQKMVQLAKSWQEQGRLEKIEDIFYLTLEDVDQAVKDPTYTLIDKIEKNKNERKRFEKVHYPSLIDSRGYIPRPTAGQTKKGDVAGTPVSPGIIRGKIKVLHTPSEKILHKGEILVAKATDPGWTPLFANAAAVILEIGGVLQHGALVAREYGLPCVTGIPNATTLWKDGTVVEVNGTEGTVRVI